jgi:molybdopterin molybdotransferase
LGEKNGHYIAGMPGNPVSSFVIFEMLIKTLINKLSGLSAEKPDFLVPIDSDFERKKSDLLIFIPVTLTPGGTVAPLEYHGSAHINSYTLAHGIMSVPKGINHIQKGSLVHVRPL